MSMVLPFIPMQTTCCFDILFSHHLLYFYRDHDLDSLTESHPRTHRPSQSPSLRKNIGHLYTYVRVLHLWDTPKSVSL